MQSYNYLESMKDDIRDVIWGYTSPEELAEDRDGVEELLNDQLWTDDGVTGNGSGSYTFNTAEAREYVCADGAEYLREAAKEFCLDPRELVEHFLNNDWEWFDVTIRCYLLGQAIAETLDELEAQDDN